MGSVVSLFLDQILNLLTIFLTIQNPLYDGGFSSNGLRRETVRVDDRNQARYQRDQIRTPEDDEEEEYEHTGDEAYVPYVHKDNMKQEEAGTPRVQVNAGYKNPRIVCESGVENCSGVLLKWVLTLHGTA